MLVAGLFAGGHETRADPPHHGVKPEQRLDRHVDYRGQVVATPHVADLVRDNRGELIVGQVPVDPCRQEDHRPPEANDAWFEDGWCNANLDVGRHGLPAVALAKAGHRDRQRRAGANSGAYLAPLPHTS
jgi:hypothetical protein